VTREPAGLVLSFDDTRALLLDIIRRYPDNRNPLSDNGLICLYTNAAGRHCLIGQLAYEQGWEMPSDTRQYLGAATQATDLRWPLSPEAVDLATYAQSVADQRIKVGDPARPAWGKLDHLVRVYRCTEPSL